jgi:hypothetical protein
MTQKMMHELESYFCQAHPLSIVTYFVAPHNRKPLLQSGSNNPIMF